MVNIGTITNEAYLGIGIFLTILTAGLIAARFTHSIRQNKRLMMDDWLTFAAYTITLALYVFNQFQFKSFFKPMDFAYATKTAVAIPLLAAFSLWTSKAPILIVYIRIFGVRTWIRYTCYFVLVASAFGFIASFIPPLVQCRPSDKPYSIYKWRRCGKANIDAGVIAGTVSVAADLCILILPLRPVFSLNLSRRRRWGLGIVFFSGIFGVVASLLSLVYKINLLQGKRSDTGSILTAMLLQFVECAIAIMVGCVPATSGFWNRFIKPSRFYSSVLSLRTRIVSTLSRVASRESLPKTTYEANGFEPGNNDTYVLVESARGSKHELNRSGQ